jgi:putative heme transporter
MEIQLPESERRWLRAVLILGTFVLAFVLIAQVSVILVFFSDLLLILLLAWLFAFMISPLVTLILRALPWAPRVVVVAAIYIAIALGAAWATLTVAGSLANSIGSFIAELPTLQARLPDILRPWQEQLNALGFQVNLIVAAQEALTALAGLGDELAGPLAELALASVTVLAQLLIVVFLSLFIVLDKDRIVAYLNRLVPPRWSDEANLFQTSVASSFGGFLRGQAIQGLILAGIVAVIHFVFGLDFLPASAALAGVLQAIPFFVPIVAWAPPVVVALLTSGDTVAPVLLASLGGWFVVNNVVLPRVMAQTVGIHPVAVLISVLVGLKLAGIAGAVFALPIAAVLSAFFHHFLNRTAAEPRDVTSRAARRVEQRSGKRVRVPQAPPVTLAEAAPSTEMATKANPEQLPGSAEQPT